MANPTLETITREEFDRRLDESNARRRHELQRKEEEQARIEQLLAHYEQILDEMERELEASHQPLPEPSLFRKRLEELAHKTAEMAASL